ncbi:MAG TPA: contractile injection system tape measure protein [Chitinophagaceae bacterium]
MLNDVIHKMLFEVECREEDTARALQHTIHHYTWPMIDKTINILLTEVEQHIIIDRLELQLGELSLLELEGNSFAEAFESNFRKSLLAWSNKYMDKPIEERQTGKTNWDIIETFLLYGDLPWWVDKKEGVDVENIMRSMIHSNPARVETFLANQKDKVAHTRLWQLLTNRDRDRFSEWFNIIQNKHDITSAFSPGLITLLQDPFNQITLQQKKELQKLIQVISVKYRGDHSWKAIEKKLPRLFKRIEEIGVTTMDASQKVEVAKRIEILLRKTGLIDHAFSRKLMKIWRLQYRRRKELMRVLFQNDRFHEFPLLKLILEHPTPFDKSVHDVPAGIITIWSRTSNILAAQLCALKPREQMQYHNLLNNGASAASDKKLIKKLVNTLPIESLQLVTALAELNEELLQNLLVESESADHLSMSEREIIVENAGACLIAAYLPAFFKELGYVKNSRFKTKTHTIRAIYLLHYIVNGKTESPEYLLQLNKVLCEWNLTSSLPSRKRWRKSELQEADELLRSIVRNWSALKNTSIDGLRTNFLQRKGILTENDHYWSLKVEKKGVDVLLGSISWPFGLVKLPWMKKPLQVEW